MSRLIFAAWACLAVPMVLRGQAQGVPGRDLFDFPLGSMAEPQALASELGAGLWNPATIALPADQRVKIGIAAMNSPIEQGLAGQVLMAAVGMPHAITASVSVAHMNVTDLLHTETDPQSVGGEIPYATSVFSAVAAWQHRGNRIGIATRFRTATVDLQKGSVGSVDAGFVADHFLRTPVRVAASTFLYSPAARSAEPATYLGAADVPLMRPDSIWALRAGYAYTGTERRSREHYVFATSRYRRFEARGGIASSSQFGASTRRIRLGLGLQYARYDIGIAREDNGAGLGASYQFLLTSVFR